MSLKKLKSQGQAVKVTVNSKEETRKTFVWISLEYSASVHICNTELKCVCFHCMCLDKWSSVRLTVSSTEGNFVCRPHITQKQAYKNINTEIEILWWKPIYILYRELPDTLQNQTNLCHFWEDKINNQSVIRNVKWSSRNNYKNNCTDACKVNFRTSSIYIFFTNKDAVMVVQFLITCLNAGPKLHLKRFLFMSWVVVTMQFSYWI